MADMIDEEAFRDEIAENDDVERELWNEPSKEQLAQLVLREPDVYKKGIRGGGGAPICCDFAERVLDIFLAKHKSGNLVNA